MAAIPQHPALAAESVPLRNSTLHVTAARTLALYERFVRGTANTVTDSYALTLPPVGEAAGLTYTIRAESIANSKTITVNERSTGDAEGYSAFVLTATGDVVVLESDGKRWNILEEITT